MGELQKNRKRKAAQQLLTALDRILLAAEDAKRAKQQLESERTRSRRDAKGAILNA